MEDVAKRRGDNWMFLFVAGMWFQDLWTYDFSRTHQCSIPYGTQEGEISFCAYNTGVGWRQIVEKRHQTATLAQWYDKEGRHEIYTGGHSVPLATTDHTLVVAQDALSAGKPNRPRPGGRREDREGRAAARAGAGAREVTVFSSQ